MKRGTLPAVLAFLFAGCGYSTAPLVRSGYDTIAVPVFENSTQRRLHERELTEAVQKAILARTPYGLVTDPEEADLVLEGVLSEFETPSLVETREDEVLQSAVRIEFTFTVRDRRTRVALVNSKKLVERAELSGRRGETFDSARFEAMEKLARRVVTYLEAPWE